MLELLKGKSAIGGLQQISAQGGRAIIDDRHSVGRRITVEVAETAAG
jgi:hypothetical protein